MGTKKQNLKRDYCLIGLGDFNYEIGKILMREDQNVTVIEKDLNIINKLGAEFTNSIHCDAVRIHDLNDLGIKNFDYVIVGVENVEVSISICSNLKELKVERILAKAKNQLHRRILKLMGVNHSIIPELYVVENLAYGTIFDLEVGRMPYNHLEDQESELFSIRFKVENPQLWGRAISTLTFLKEHHSAIVGIKRGEGEIIIPVSPENILEKTDTVFLIAKKEYIFNLKGFFEQKNYKEGN